MAILPYKGAYALVVIGRNQPHGAKVDFAAFRLQADLPGHDVQAGRLAFASGVPDTPYPLEAPESTGRKGEG